MAYDSLKALIRQYIKTNGEQEITGQILQNVLVEMVNQYPSTDGFATQSWVTSQGYLIPGSRISLLGNDVGYLTSADLSGYATTSQLAGYLPLTGGTMTGDLNMAAYKLIFGTPYIYGSTIPGPQGTNMGHILQFAGVDGYGYYGFDNSVHATSFVKANGTATQFLKADGSVDENTYLIPGSRISLLGNDVGYLTSADLSGYATTSQLAGYLPLTGGTMTGDINMAAYKLIFGTPYIYGSTIPGPQGTNMGHILNFDGVDGYGYYNFDNSVHATSFVKANGTATQFLKADGSVDENTYLIPGSRISLLGNDVGYLTSADLSGYATTSQLAGYLPLTGGTMTGDINMAAYKLYFGTPYIYESTIPGPQGTNMGHILNFDGVDGYGYYNFDNSVHATSFVKSGGTSAQFLKADGSVDSTAYLPKQGSSFYFITDADMPETAANISTLNAAHRMTLYRNAILMPYQMDNANDGGFIRSRGTSENSAIMEIGMWDDAGAGETIQFNYYPTTSTINPTYSVTVPKKSGTIALTSDLASYNPTSNFKTINNQSIIGTGNINIEGGGGTLYDAEIEYLESTGTQYINTGIKLFESSPTNLEISMKVFANTGQSNFSCILNAMEEIDPYPGIVIRTYNNNIQIVQAQTDTAISSCGSVQNITRTENNLSYVHDVPVTLFAGLNANNAPWRYCRMKLYSLSIKRNSVLVFDAIPVRVGNVGYLYDKVSGQLFGNSGTGSFVLGQDTGPGGGSPYLPLTGGTITGNLTVNGTVKFNNNLTFANDRGIDFGTDDDVYIKRDNSRLLIINEAGDDIIIGDYDDRNYTSIVNDLQGGTTNSSYSSVTQKWYILVDGTAQFKSVSQTSDLRKKTIMGDVPMNIYNVANAPLFKFTWNNETKYSGQHIGSAAQYWQTVLPELVSIGRDADMTLAMQYDVIALASAITVAKTVVNHEERIILLERENEALKKEIADLKSA